jgi:D-arabinose 1-dehydrogenase-like Zn-dependent alcohol dehydrogenase
VQRLALHSEESDWVGSEGEVDIRYQSDMSHPKSSLGTSIVLNFHTFLSSIFHHTCHLITRTTLLHQIIMSMSSRHPLPKSQTAILQDDSGKLTIKKAVPLPVVPAGRILVKVSHVALNPCDYKMPLRFPTPDCLNGHDFSGTVVSLGPPSSATKKFAIGDRFCGAVHASNPIDKTTGAFAEYVSADAEFTLKVPKTMDMHQAAAIGGTGMGTMGLALKECFKLEEGPEQPVTDGKAKEVLVYAASTSIGTLALQLLSL